MMKSYFTLCSTVVLFAILYLLRPAANLPVNAVLGNRSSFEAGFDHPESLTEKQRIQIHLAYVEQLLRNRDMHDLSEDLRERRKTMLNLLNEYWNKGEFPTNAAYEGRRPCFIDNRGRSAVGYLIEKTAEEKWLKSSIRNSNMNT